MPKNFRPTTPGQRKLVLPVLIDLSPNGKKVPKALLEPKRRANGRNHSGHITCRHKGGAHKRQYRLIDFKRDKEHLWDLQLHFLIVHTLLRSARNPFPIH